MKRLLALLCAVLLACICFACGKTPANPGDETTSPPPETTQAPVYVTRQEYTHVTASGSELPGLYTGYMAAGQPKDSNGTLDYKNGDLYVGGWANGRFSGQGAYLWAGGAKHR